MGIARLKIEINGIVQGVGFRPFIYRIANKNNLSGFVRNSPSGVEIEIEGNTGDLENFKNDLRNEAPPISEIFHVRYENIGVELTKEFKIISSTDELANRTLISPDIAICDDCLQELFDPSNRRYLYPFINCTNCGPRLTIIENIPYDRKYTTMHKFKMCGECEKEYNDANDRRFHAQPNACPECGPNIWYESKQNTGSVNNQEAVSNAVKDLCEGKIVAVKGLGGFHLAADANNDSAVRRLRECKGREEKPFAVMVPGLEQLTDLVFMNDDEIKLLNNYARPILLLKRKNRSLAESVAPNNKRLGVMLAYTPLHHILLEEFKKYSRKSFPVLVMTSANFSEEPIEITNEGAKERLGTVADSFLMHNRDILIRTDDSVVININNKLRVIRRSRGFVPKPLFTMKSESSVLGVGAELKNTICLLKEDKAFVSQHIGDLTNYSASEYFKETVNYLQKIIDRKAEIIAHDLHPDYLSTKWAKEESNLPLIGIQHHHAHMASCMAEHGLTGDAIGIILDGTGFGTDGTIWGGEILVGGFTKVGRFAHLEYVPLPGGDAAIKEPWRIAVSYLHHSFDGSIPQLDYLKNEKPELILQMLNKKINSPLTSSAGRLFDAVSVLCGGPKKIRYEAQAAIDLMQKIENTEEPPYEIKEEEIKLKSIPLKSLIRNVVRDVQRDITASIIGARFHKTFALMLIRKAEQARTEKALDRVALSGGVFQNEYLLKLMEDELSESGFEVYSHSKVPTNDGGISFGQVVIASELIKKGMKKVIFEL